MAKILLALHGLHSSPNSLKIQQMKSYIDEHCPDITLLSPQLPAMPDAMWKVVESIFESHLNDQIAVMGSSLGGYLAAKAALEYNVKTLLINPAVSPWKLTSFAGEQVHPYTHEKYQMDEIYQAQLKALDVDYVGEIDKCWLLLQKGDQVLDYRIAFDKYINSTITCEAGGDHSFIGFDRYLSDIIKFLF